MTAVSISTIAVCICTHKRPHLLRRTLEQLEAQATFGRFTYSIVVSDNDRLQSAKPVVTTFSAASSIPTSYCVEPEQNIALARNKAIAIAKGDYVAFIDDDELPARDWLATLLSACEVHDADGVLGPVRPFFDQPPPNWLIRGRFCERPEHRTGQRLHWKQTRTGNALVKKKLLDRTQPPFRREFGNGGEDQDFFRRMIHAGHRFVWCNEAVVYEVVPPERWRRSYLLRRALLRGQNERLLLNARSISRSIAAVPLYALLLPFLLPLGQHLFLRYLIRLLDHAGKLLAAIGLQPVGTRYLSDQTPVTSTLPVPGHAPSSLDIRRHSFPTGDVPPRGAP
jgi:succinoglycan biosynthesis protein ExoM